MEDILFNDLVQSLKEAKAIAKGEMKPSRRFVMQAPDAKTVREGAGLTQSEFASLMRVSIKTLQNWEQHRRTPTGPAAALLKSFRSPQKLRGSHFTPSRHDKFSTWLKVAIFLIAVRVINTPVRDVFLDSKTDF